MTIRPKMFAFLAGCCFSMPFLEAQGKLAKFQLPADQAISCSRVGEVLGRDMFGQAFLLKQEAGGLEEIPFSRWTEFFKIPSDLGIAERRAIEPADIRLGDRVCVVLDTSQATARLILVMERAKAPVQATAAGGFSLRQSAQVGVEARKRQRNACWQMPGRPESQFPQRLVL